MESGVSSVFYAALDTLWLALLGSKNKVCSDEQSRDWNSALVASELGNLGKLLVLSEPSSLFVK